MFYRRVASFLFAIFSLWVVDIGDAKAFEYLEHSYLSDRACWQAQGELAQLLEKRPDDAALQARYLAMAIACPERSPEQYCIDGQKAVTSQISRVGGRAWEDSEFPLTFGDVTALGDHVSRFGPIDGLSGARQPGLTRDIMEWFSDAESSVDSVIGRVAGRGCSDGDMVSWNEVESDVESVSDRLFQTGEPEAIPPQLLDSLARATPERGPSDPEVRYTISNPHYLDLVLRNHLHFGEEAFDTWLGFHSASISIADRPCEATFAMGRSDTEDFADDLVGFDDVDWDELSDPRLATMGCAVLAEHAKRTLLDWAEHADPELTAPVEEFLSRLRDSSNSERADDTARVNRQLNQVVASLKGLIFQGSGLHYLQDGFAGGHVRTIRTRGGLAESRHDHNYDNEQGVSAVLRTRAGDYPFVAYGDQFLLGRHREAVDDCDWQRLRRSAVSPDEVTACLLRYQRGLTVATSAASLVDWAVGGILFEPVEPRRCAASRQETAVCSLLPITAVSAPGSLPPRNISDTSGVHPGNLPVPPPPFAYESLVTTVAFDVGGSKSQYGLQLTMLSQFDRFAHWMTSYRAALLGSNVAGDDAEVLADFSYNFHYRISARVHAEAGLGVFGGFSGIGDSLSFKSGLSPSVGLVALPEGWLKLPVEVSASFRFPMTFFTSTDGFFGDSFDAEAFWLQFGLGLAFM